MILERRWGTQAGPAVLAAALLGALLAAPVAHADSRDQAKRLHDRITGVPPSPELLDDMADDIDRGDPFAAAMRATDVPEFYSVKLKNFAAPWTNRERNVFVPLNDYTATIIGVVRDDLDFRSILSADLVYIGSGPGVPAYSPSNNAHYIALEQSGANLRDVLQPTTQSSVSGIPSDAAAGIMTTRAAAKSFFIAGTNRAMFRFTLVNHLCMDLEQVLDVSRPPDRIRQDVSRSPGGDSRVFLNNCVGCHAGMDPLAQGFAYYDYAYDRELDPEGEAGRITYNGPGQIDPRTGTRVVGKYFNNATTFPPGFQTPDDAWTNHWRVGQNSLVGWDDTLPGAGNGAASLGRELANTQAFAQCQVRKVFENVCHRPPQDAQDRAYVDDLVRDFRNQGYNLKTVFAASAVYCMGD